MSLVITHQELSASADSKLSGLLVNVLWRNNRHSLLEGSVGGKNFGMRKEGSLKLGTLC